MHLLACVVPQAPDVVTPKLKTKRVAARDTMALDSCGVTRRRRRGMKGEHRGERFFEFQASLSRLSSHGGTSSTTDRGGAPHEYSSCNSNKVDKGTKAGLGNQVGTVEKPAAGCCTRARRRLHHQRSSLSASLQQVYALQNQGKVRLPGSSTTSGDLLTSTSGRDCRRVRRSSKSA